MTITLSRQLADWASGLQRSHIPPSAREFVNLRVLDTVGLISAGMASDAGRSICALAADAPAGPSRVVGNQERTKDAKSAAMVHGVLAHCRDFDDTFMDSLVHPGSVVVPTAISIAEACDSSNEDFETAIIIGYEVAARVGSLAGRRLQSHGFHSTGVIGPIAAAVTAGRLLNLSGEQMSWAIGLSCSMSGGLMSFMADGAWSKWMHAGWAAKSGIAAAELAAKNFVGPERVFERDQGLYRSFLFGEDIDMAGVLDGLGDVWQGSRAEFKYFPSAHVIQPYVESLLTIVVENDLRMEQIQSIDCGLPSWAAGVVAEPREARLKFSSELEAIASLYFQLASAVLDRNVNLKSLQKTQRSRPELLSLAERISHHSVPSSTSTLEGDLTLSTASGEKYRSRVQVSPPDKTRIEEKFKTNLAIATPSVREHKIEFLTQAMLSASLPNWRHAGQLVSYFAWPA